MPVHYRLQAVKLFVVLFMMFDASWAMSDESFYAAQIRGVACLRVPVAWPALWQDELRKKQEHIRDAAVPKLLDEQLLFYATGQDTLSGAWGVEIGRAHV